MLTAGEDCRSDAWQPLLTQNENTVSSTYLMIDCCLDSSSGMNTDNKVSASTFGGLWRLWHLSMAQNLYHSLPAVK